MLGINKSMRKIMYYENILEFKENCEEELNLNEINNWKLCRTCLADTDENDINMENMSIMDVMHGKMLNIKEMLVEITSIKIWKTENLPLHVCNTCFSKITELYYFCIQIRKAEKLINRLAKMFTDHTDVPCETNNNIEIEVQDYFQDVENISVIANVSIEENEIVKDELPKEEAKEPSEQFEEIASAVLHTGEEATMCNNEAVLFQDEDSLSESHTELKNGFSDEESNFENNLIEYLETCDADNEEPSSNSTAETIESVNSQLKKTKERAHKKRTNSGTTGYRHKQPRVTSPLLDDFDCAICQISFDRQQDLVQHVRESHPNSKAYKCRVCSNFFSHIQSLSRHMNSHKDTVILNKCKFCSKLFVRVDDLKRHLRVHTGERPYVCSICEKSFQQQSDLKYHLKKHDYEEKNLQPVIYECNQCKKGYTSRTGLNWHKKTHHKQEKEKQAHFHHCSVCDEFFKTVSDLKRHSVVHQPEHISESQKTKESEKENEVFTIIDDED